MEYERERQYILQIGVRGEAKHELDGAYTKHREAP